MKETSGYGPDVDTDSVLEDINVEPPTKRSKPTEPNEQNDDKKELAEMPKEVLAEILVYLDVRSLLKASHVCKSFASAVEMAFARKYSKNYYFIDYRVIDDVNLTTTKSFDKVMLNKYGGKIRSIAIFAGDEEILDLVEQKCCNVKNLKLVDVPKIIMLRDLKRAYFHKIHDSRGQRLGEFIDINPQLEYLDWQGDYTNLLAMLNDRPNNLKTLRYVRATDVGIFQPTIEFKSLEMLYLSLKDTANCIRCLKSMNCNQIKKLVLKSRKNPNDNDDDGVINEICKFETLVSLEVSFHRITLDKVSKLTANLPHLTEFCMGTTVDETEFAEKILSISSMLSEITKLKFRMGKDDFNRFANELKRSPMDFYTRFVRRNTEIKFMNSDDLIHIQKNFLFMALENSVELHWMHNLNEKDVRKKLILWSSRTELKFIDNCADCSFDISILAGCHMKCLDFKSNGPISVKSNVSRYPNIFPNLKTLKIHLEQHSANDFISSLGTDFCEQIEELWLNTKTDAENPDMTNVLAKFENLESLHLAPTSIKFDACQLFSECRKLTEIKRI